MATDETTLTRDERELANKYMLIGIDFALVKLGVVRDELLARFIKDEFQKWVRDEAAAPVGSRARTSKGQGDGKAAGGAGVAGAARNRGRRGTGRRSRPKL